MAIPTPPPALTTSCFAVSRLLSEYTYTHTISEVQNLISTTTTHTQATTVTTTYPGDVVATCFTDPNVNPNDVLSTLETVPFFHVTCSTYTLPATMETTSRSAGEVNTFLNLNITYTTGFTSTSVTPERTGVFCDPVPLHEDPSTCDTVTPLTWASLILTFILVQLSWWVTEVPLLWRENGSRIWGFLGAVTWSCFRANMPGSAGLIALMLAKDGMVDAARIYYLGLPWMELDERRFTPWKLVVSIGGDLLAVVTTVITIYQACTLPEFDTRRFGLSYWAYPTLPTAVVGLCFLAGWWLSPVEGRRRESLSESELRSDKGVGKAVIVTAAVTLLLLAVAGVAVALLLWRFNSKSDNVWFMSIIFYGLMAFPAILFLPAIPIAMLYGGFARVGGVFIAALSHHAGGQPYCKMPGVGFAVVYFIGGAVSALLAGLGAWPLSGVALGMAKSTLRRKWREWRGVKGPVSATGPGPETVYGEKLSDILSRVVAVRRG